MIRRIFAVLFACAACASAHHGRDYLLLQDPNVPVFGEWFAFSNYGWSSQTGDDEESLDLGLTTGLFPRTAFTTSIEYSNEAESSWDWSSLVTSIQFDLTPARRDFPFKLGIILGREFTLTSASGHSHAHTDPVNPEINDPDFDPGPDWIPPDTTTPHTHGGVEVEEHEHSGIHQHGIDAYQARLVLEAPMGEKTRLAANFIALFPDQGESVYYGYAVGIRHALNADLALGLEITGDFDRHLYQEAAAAVYYSPVHPVTLKFGIGAGLNSASPELSMLSGLVWRF